MILLKATRLFLALALALLFFGGEVAAQTIISGDVTDAKTKETLPFVSVFFAGSNLGVTTDINGHYLLKTDSITDKKLVFSFVGYKTRTFDVQSGTTYVLNVALSSEAKVLQEVTVVSGKDKEKYRNKNNPAVDLIRKVIEHKNANRPESYAYAEYEQYEKLEISLSNVTSKFRERKMFRKYKFLFQNVDTTKMEGKALLPIYLQETLSNNFYRKDPEKKKEYITAVKEVTFDDYIDNRGLSGYLNHLYQDIDIYSNNISVFTNQFLSPIADNAPTFYKFYITDTLKDSAPKLVELSFVPRNKTDFLFQGKIYVTLDSVYAVQKSELSVSKDINLNFVRELKLGLDFEPTGDGRYHLVKSRMLADFGLSKDGGGIFGERTVSQKNFIINKVQPPQLYEGPGRVVVKDKSPKPSDFWETHRHDSLTNAESKVYGNIDSLQKMPSFRRTANLLTFILAGFKSFGPFEIGPTNTFYSFNPVEGFRLRLGGRTTPKFNDHIYLESYAAYGFKDEKWKYYFGGAYSFTGRSIREFPIRSLSASFQRDTKIPGQELQFIQEDNFLLSFKRGVNDKWLYNDIWNIYYLNEFENHFSWRVGFKNWKQTPAGGLRYEIERGDVDEIVPDVITSEASLELRWAPGEKFYQGKLYRIPIPNKYPIVTLRGIAGIKGLFGSEYNYQNLTVNFYKRFYLSQLGYTDVVAEGGYIFGSVPFPLLDIHRANQTYSYQLQSYNLMNFLEFVSDHYVSLNIDHYFNGFIFNKLPLIKKLKLREVVTAKLLYGGIRRENDPTKNTELFNFPKTAAGETATFSLDKEPYIEASAGISNIFKFFRIDFVKRFSYLDHPNISDWGIRGRFKFDF